MTDGILQKREQSMEDSGPHRFEFLWELLLEFAPDVSLSSAAFYITEVEVRPAEIACYH
jgi:hypothetical protein